MINTKDMALRIKEWIEDKKGYNIQLIDIHELTSLADVFVVASGSSERQVAAIADNIEEKAKEEDYEILHREGRQSGRWILLDYNSIVVHIFHEEERDFYDLERLWADGKEIDK